MFGFNRYGMSYNARLGTRRSASTFAAHSSRTRPPVILGISVVVVTSTLLSLQRLGAANDHKDVLLADSSNTDSNINQDVVVLDRSNGTAPTQAHSSKSSSLLPSLPNWSSIKEKVTDAVLPKWAKDIPGYYEKLQSELSAAPGSLASEIWAEAHNAAINPEIEQSATVRVSDELCDEEKEFLAKRKKHTAKALALYLGLHETEVHPDDVPTIALCGSGGGLRALVAGTSSYLSAQEAGLFDCATFTAGVSGSCWLQALYYSSLTGQRHDRLIEHLKRRLDVHITFPPPLLNMLTTAPTNKYLLSGGYEKYRGVDGADFGIVDIYGVMLGARLLVPSNELSVDGLDLKISNQRRFLDDGQHPLPIYTAVHHEITRETLQAELNANNVENLGNTEKAEKKPVEWQKYRPDFQWLEWTPYEFFCEDFGAGIPTWSVGRAFSKGYTVWRDDGKVLPELRLPMLMGIFGSAFCATLSHYYKEIRPIVQNLAGLGAIDTTLMEQDEELIKVHPIDPAQVPNFVRDLSGLPQSCPDSLRDASNIQLMDAGMSNNLPIYPLLRPGRDVDILVAFDASADVRKDNWLKVAEGYSTQRGVKNWPAGSGWPAPTVAPKDDTDKKSKSAEEPEEAIPQFEGEDSAEARLPRLTSSPTDSDHTEGTDLGYCTVWIGDTTTPDKVYSASSSSSPRASHPGSSTLFKPHASPSASSGEGSKEDHNPLHSPTAGLAVVYFPLIPNPAVPSVDPQTSDFMSTWNFVYKPEQVDDVVALARANFKEGEELVKEVVRGVWERKRAMRLGKLGKIGEKHGEGAEGAAHMG